MDVEPFIIKRGDRLPYLQATLADAAGALPNLTDATVHFVLQRTRPAQTLVRAPATIVDAAARVVRYEWGADDTAEPGTYRAEFEVTLGGRARTFPQPGSIPVHILPDCG